MPAIIHHLDLYGKRGDKYDTLESLSLADATLTELAPTAPYYFFVPKNTDGQVEYEGGFGIQNIFTLNTTGIVTSADDFMIQYKKDVMEENIQALLIKKISSQQFILKYKLGKNYTEWLFSAILNNKVETYQNSKITKVTYRPFDDRYTYFDDRFLWRSRRNISKHMLLGNNLSLITARSNKNPSMDHFFVSRYISEAKTGESSTQSMFFPLYLYSDSETLEGTTKTPNLDATIWSKISDCVGRETTPEEVFDYIYAVLHSPSYREKYKEFLKIDFPRVPYPTSRESFESLVRLGGELRELHLLESPKVEEYITTFPVAGTNEVEKISYVDGRVYINSEQYFGDVPSVAWEFYIGGYQPARKWLGDRKGRTLTWEDIAHYQSMIVALTETARVMKEVDEVLESNGK